MGRCSLSDKRQRELCLSCHLPECDEASPACPIRVEINKNLRRQYWKDPEKARASRRKAAIPADQYERKKAYMRRYYQQNRERILARQKALDAAKRNGETNEQS